MTDVIFRDMWKLSGMSEDEFNATSRVAVVERMRGRHAATTSGKAEFIAAILDHMAARGHIRSWSSIGSSGRADYRVALLSGRTAVIEAKGSMDGNSATILERPSFADELVIWTITTNPMSDVVRNLWSGIHTRISPEYIATGKRVDMVLAWDMLGSSTTLRPELADLPEVEVANLNLPLPSVYLMPHELPVVGLRDVVQSRGPRQVEFARSLAKCFGLPEHLMARVSFEVAPHGDGLARRTTITSGNRIIKASRFTPIRRDLRAYLAACEAEKAGKSGSR